MNEISFDTEVEEQSAESFCNERLAKLLQKYNGKDLIRFRQLQKNCLIEHQDRVASMASRLAVEMGMNEEQEEAIFIAASLHDIGMQQFRVPDKISDYNRIKLMKQFHQHAEIGARITGCLTHTLPIDDIILQHHERLDGSGFPHNSREILTEARIIAVVDVMDGIYALHNNSPEKGIIYACYEVDRLRNGLLDPDIIDLSIELARDNQLFEDRAYNQ